LVGVGCAALADHLRATSWPSKFRPHLPEKYDGTSNPSEFLQVYVTAITAAGGNTAVMVTYFHVALSGPARTWLMNLAPGSIYSWEELYARFVANFASAYQQHGVEAHLHAVRQEPGETLRMFISRFTKVRGTIPRISDASICKENGPRAIWLIEFWCLMNNTIRELISFQVFVFVVHRMRRELDQGNEDATPQKKT
jgi:hypothetical protein